MAIYSGNKLTQSFIRNNFGSAVGNVVEIGEWTVGNGAHAMRVSIIASISGFSTCKTYEIAVQYGQTGLGQWRRVLPIATPGGYSNNDFELEAQVNGPDIKLRIIKTFGTTAGNYQITVDYYSYNLPDYGFVESTATGTGITPNSGSLAGFGLQTYDQGAVVLRNPEMPSFNARYSVASTTWNVNADGWQKIPFDQTDWNVSSNFSTTNNRFTAPVSGKYLFGCELQLESPSYSGNPWMYITFLVNGSTGATGQGGTRTDVAHIDVYNGYSVTELYNLAAGDYVEMWRTGNVTSITFKGGTESCFWGYLVG